MEAETIQAVEFHACKGGELQVMLPKALEKKLFYLRSPRNLEILEKSLTDQLATPLRLVFLLAEGNKTAETAPAVPATAPASSKPAPPPPNLSQEAFLADPVIQNALKIFEAKIVTPAAR